jgi:hypothetical protein
MFASKLSAFSALLLIGISLQIPSSRADDLGFVLCGSECGDGKFYVGYNHTNLVKLDQAVVSLPKQKDKFFLHVADLKKSDRFPSINEQRIDLENGNYASSLYRFEGVRVGYMRKSESMHVASKSTAEAGSTVNMLWGDTLKISSSTLRRGTPVVIQVQRNISGFGAPATDFSYYKLKSQTLWNGSFLADLDYTFEKQPGVGELEKKIGNEKSTISINAEVGDSIKIESKTVVKDGVISSSSPQVLNGADWVEYNIKTLTPGVDLRSESGVFPN